MLCNGIAETGMAPAKKTFHLVLEAYSSPIFDAAGLYNPRMAANDIDGPFQVGPCNGVVELIFKSSYALEPPYDYKGRKPASWTGC